MNIIKMHKMDFKLFKAKFKKKFKNFTKKYNKLIEKSPLFSFFVFIFSYGIGINYTLWVIWGVPFNWYGFPAYGFLAYLIMEEVTRTIVRIKK